METIILYLIKVNLAFSVLYLIYKLIFNRDTFLNLKRYVLLLICIVSVLYPFIQFDFIIHDENVAVDTLFSIQNLLLPETVVSTVENEGRHINWLTIISIVYIIGIALLTVRSLIEIIRVIRKISQSRKSVINGVSVWISETKTEPYSFLKWICISPDLYKREELNEILSHENTHAREWHSLDVLFAQMLVILNWFNPFVWLLRNEIRINHEYLADRKVINSGYNKRSYQYHLIGFTQTQTLSTALYNNFSVLPIKSRLKMLNRKATPGFMVYKYLLFLPIIALLLIFSNCQNGEIENQEVIPLEEPSTASETIFEIVEKMPEFPGGQTALMRYLNSSIKYPSKAQEAGVQGRVIVQFIVHLDGSIKEPVVVRSVEENLDKEALRVISQMPKWIPGHQRGRPVSVKYTVPIQFRLQ